MFFFFFLLALSLSFVAAFIAGVASANLDRNFWRILVTFVFILVSGLFAVLSLYLLGLSMPTTKMNGWGCFMPFSVWLGILFTIGYRCRDSQ